jgi:hypothetical protein
MKDLSLLVSFVAPSVRNASTRSATTCVSNYSPALSPMRKIVGDNFSAIRRDSLVLRAQNMDTSSVASSMMGQEPSGVYEAVLPQTETLVGMGVIVVLCVLLYWVWENQVVPVSRTKLAISKSRGEVKEYLDELKASSPSSTIEPSAHSLSSESISLERVNSVGESSLQLENVTVDGEENSVGNPQSSPLPATTGDRSFERWLFTDWLQDNKSERKGGRQKEPALPILKSAKWNSGDNPVVVAALLMLVGILFTVITERMA